MSGFPAPIDLSLLPDSPGIYKMLDDRGVVIYVGKAKSLKKRVRSYFQGVDRHDIKTRHLVGNISAIETIVVRSESDALILEAQLIKEYKPRYNINLKDDKAYPYIKVTNEPFPRVLIVRERQSDGASYFGPYPSIGSTRYLQRMIHDIFPLRDCAQSIDLVRRQPKCIKLDIQKCIGPCVFKTIKSDYDGLINQLKRLLSGKNKQLVAELTNQMHEAATQRHFERAAELRDQLKRIGQLGERQSVVIAENGVHQIWAAVEENGFLYVVIQTLIDGKLLYQNGYYLENPTEFNRRYFVEQCVATLVAETDPLDGIFCDDWMAGVIQDLIMLDGIAAPTPHVPRRGQKVVLLDMARQNGRLAIRRLIRDRSIGSIRPKKEDLLGAVQLRLSLRKRPIRIIGVDISHLQGTNIVGSAVYFKDGTPYKAGYRKFSIKSVSGDSNDPASIYEVVSRRLQRCFTDHEPLPDLLLIDGGKGQLNAAYRALVELGLSEEIELVSLAKQHEELFRIQDPASLVLSRDDIVLKLFQWIRDESHRFALTFQRKKRQQQLETGLLSDIPGLGPKRIQSLYTHFKSMTQLLDATDAHIASVARISLSLVRVLREKVRQNITHDHLET